jgi:hypothetical protein
MQNEFDPSDENSYTSMIVAQTLCDLCACSESLLLASWRLNLSSSGMYAVHGHSVVESRLFSEEESTGWGDNRWVNAGVVTAWDISSVPDHLLLIIAGVLRNE